MSELSVFNFDSYAVRTVQDEATGEPLFVGKDVCDALGYANASAAIKQHCKGFAKRYPLQTAGGVQEARVLTKSDVLRLIISSNLPEAERFEAWVFEEVLPAVLKTGQYIAPQVLKDLIEGAAERAVENYKALDSVNFNMLKQDVTIMDILACKAGHGPDGIKRLTVQLLRKYGRPDLIGMLEMLGEVSDYDQHQSWAAVEELAQSYLKELVAARKQAGKKPLPEPTPEELEAVSLNWRMKYMPYSLVTSPVFVTHLTSEVSAPVSAAKAFARNHINMSLNRVTGQTTATWNGSANLNQLLLAK